MATLKVTLLILLCILMILGTSVFLIEQGWLSFGEYLRGITSLYLSYQQGTPIQLIAFY